MEEYLKNNFQKEKIEPEFILKDKIWQKIIKREKRIIYFKLISFSSLGIASILGFIPLFKIALNDFIQSGFYEYLSIAFSKNGILSPYWKDFAYSLAESIPTISTLFVLVSIFIFFLSLKYIIKQVINNNYIGQSYAEI